MEYIVKIDDACVEKFLGHGRKLVTEYPDAEIFASRRAALDALKRQAVLQGREGRVYRNYGLAGEVIVAEITAESRYYQAAVEARLKGELMLP